MCYLYSFPLSAWEMCEEELGGWWSSCWVLGCARHGNHPVLILMLRAAGQGVPRIRWVGRVRADQRWFGCRQG